MVRGEPFPPGCAQPFPPPLRQPRSCPRRLRPSLPSARTPPLRTDRPAHPQGPAASSPADPAGDDSADAARGLPPHRNPRSRPGPDPAAGTDRPASRSGCSLAIRARSSRLPWEGAPARLPMDVDRAVGSPRPARAPRGRSRSCAPPSDRGRCFRPARSSRDHSPRLQESRPRTHGTASSASGALGRSPCVAEHRALAPPSLRAHCRNRPNRCGLSARPSPCRRSPVTSVRSAAGLTRCPVP